MTWTAQPLNDRLKRWCVTAPGPGRGKPVVCDHIRTEAHARLIAAAPDLLAALEKITEARDVFEIVDAVAAAKRTIQEIRTP